MISSTKRSGCIPQLTLVMGIVICIFSCKENKQAVVQQKTDSVIVAYAPKGTENWALTKAVYGIGKKWAYGDSAHSEGNYKIDTNSWKFYILTDTMRDINRKPIFDTASKSWKMRWDWIELTEAQKQSINIHILPKNK